MILLESFNRSVAETVKSVIIPDPDYKPSPSETRICDFDNASFLVKVEESDLARVYVSLSLPCYSEIKNMGARDAVEAAFPGLISPETEAGYDFTISVGKSDYEGKETEMIEKLANVKSITLGGVFEKYYKALNDKNTSSLSNFKFNLRPDTTIYIIPNVDRIYTTFQLSFMDKSDMEIGKVFLTEFADPAQRRKVQRAPLVSYDITPPSHLKPFGVETINKADLGFVSFTVLDMHVTDATRYKVVDCMSSFRNFVQYHLKCAKSYFHSRMRLRVADLVKVLNRAKSTTDTNQPKRITTAAGKTLLR